MLCRVYTNIAKIPVGIKIYALSVDPRLSIDPRPDTLFPLIQNTCNYLYDDK